MNIGGFQKLSLIDFPATLSAIVFVAGCPFRCRFCYNKELVVPPFKKAIPEEEVLSFLEKRKGKLKGVVITGGEPTTQPDLIPFIQKVRKLGYKIKLDTNGYRPQVIQKLLIQNLLDYIAMDIKAPLERYESIVAVPVDSEAIKMSIKLVIESGVPYEFRTTLVPGFHTQEDIQEMAKLLMGAEKYYLQTLLHTAPMLDETLVLGEPFSDEELEEFVRNGRGDVREVALRH